MKNRYYSFVSSDTKHLNRINQQNTLSEAKRNLPCESIGLVKESQKCLTMFFVRFALNWQSIGWHKRGNVYCHFLLKIFFRDLYFSLCFRCILYPRWNKFWHFAVTLCRRIVFSLSRGNIFVVIRNEARSINFRLNCRRVYSLPFSEF